MAKTDNVDYKQYIVRRTSINGFWKLEEKIQMILFGLCKPIAITTLCRVNNVSPALYYEWKKLFFDGGEEALSGNEGLKQREITLEKKVETLERYIGELILEKELVKKNSHN